VAVQQLPRLVHLMAQAQGGLTSLRPAAVRHINSGRYGDVLDGWRGEASICRRRLSSEVVASRLPLASGEALVELADSEYWATIPAGPRKAVGAALLKRQITNSSASTTGNFTVGTIQAGSRFRRPAASTAQPPREESLYEAREPVYLDANDTEPVVDLGGGSYQHEQRTTVIVDAEREGQQGNTPRYIGSAGAELAADVVSTLFDTTLSVVTLTAAGGRLEVEDEQLRLFSARAYSGRLGPIDNAILAGAYSHGGVWRAVLVEDETDAVAKLYLADLSWASSDELAAEVAQTLLGKGPESLGTTRRWLGFGARVDTRTVQTQIVNVKTTVQLRSIDYTQDATEISQNIRDAITDYFDNREDWYTWRLNGLGSAISTADRRILAATSVEVRDPDGAAISEPAATVDPSTDTYLTHWALVDQSLEPTYTIPG
jgi:hypothetical protein